MVAKGDMFGADQPIILHLLDIAPALDALNGVVLELEDCAFTLLQKVVATTSVEEAFRDIDYAVLVGSFPRREGMERKDLLAINGKIFKEQGSALNNLAKRDVKVLVVGNPANTNCAIAKHYAPDLPAHNFSCLTRLDHNRARGQLAKKAGVRVENVKNVTIWGNHSSTQFPDARFAYVTGSDGSRTAAYDAITDHDWLAGEFISVVQTRGAAIIKARKLSSAASAAKAICDHIHDWRVGTTGDEWVSMGIPSDGSYGIPEGIVYSFPVRIEGGRYSVVQGLEVDSFQPRRWMPPWLSSRMRSTPPIPFWMLNSIIYLPIYRYYSHF